VLDWNIQQSANPVSSLIEAPELFKTSGLLACKKKENTNYLPYQV